MSRFWRKQRRIQRAERRLHRAVRRLFASQCEKEHARLLRKVHRAQQRVMNAYSNRRIF